MAISNVYYPNELCPLAGNSDNNRPGRSSMVHQRNVVRDSRIKRPKGGSRNLTIAA